MGELDVRTLYVLTGFIVGCLYGIVAQSTAFCVRRGISDLAEGKGGITLTGWLGALLIAVPMTQWMILDGHLNSSQTVYFPESLSWWTTLTGAAIFGAGMMLTRGCPARLVVLSGSGNLRAWFGLFVIGLSAYATFKGLMAETRVELQQTGALQLPTESILLLAPVLGLGCDCGCHRSHWCFCVSSWIESKSGGRAFGRSFGCWFLVDHICARSR